MNRFSLFQAALLSLGLCSSGASSAEQLVFEIGGVKSSEGKIYIQLFKGEQAYQAEKPISASIIPAAIGSVTVRFDGLESGEYSLRYFHDENGDGELATNLLGMPTEGYGFSNGAKPNFGPVKYKAIKFEVNGPVTTNHSSVIY